jgi:ankyrin repeat protein
MEKELITACEKGDIKAVRNILNRCANPKNVDEPPVIVACKNGHEEIVKLLLDRGADYDRYGYKGTPLISLACEKGYFDIVKILIEDHKVDLESDYYTRNITPLMYAIISKNEDIIKYLLERASFNSLNSKTDHGEIPLFIAVDGNDFDIFKMVCEASQRAGVNLRHKNRFGVDILAMAAYHMNADIIEYLFVNNIYDIENYDKGVNESKEIIARYKPNDLEFRNQRYELIDSIANKILLARETTGFLSLKSKGMPNDLVRHSMTFYRSKKNRSKKGGRTKRTKK